MKWGGGRGECKCVIIPDDDVFGTLARAQNPPPEVVRGLWLIRSSTSRAGGGEEQVRCQDVPAAPSYRVDMRPNTCDIAIRRAHLVANCNAKRLRTSRSDTTNRNTKCRNRNG